MHHSLTKIEKSSSFQSISASSSKTSSSTSAADPMGTFLKSVEAAIFNESLGAAQTALSIFQSQPFPGSTYTSTTQQAPSVWQLELALH